jgi:hypothetical protein
MADRRRWLRRRALVGLLLLVAGLVVVVGSVVAGGWSDESGSNFRVVGGFGMGLGGAGLGLLVRYGTAMRNEEAARRIVAGDLDERIILFRQRAAARAYWTSAPLVFGGLMWTSYASQGQLPKLEGDTLWAFLAFTLVVPLAVYAGSLVLDDRRS